jgi:hypothetical protein
LSVYRQGFKKGLQNPEVEKTGKKTKEKKKEKKREKKNQGIGASRNNTDFDRLPIVAFFSPFLAKFSQLGVLVSK